MIDLRAEQLFLRRHACFLGAALALAVSGSAWGAERIFGMLDPKTGIFTPAEANSNEEKLPGKTVTVSGTVVVVTKFKVSASIPADATVASGAAISVASAPGSSLVRNKGAVIRDAANGTATVRLTYLMHASSNAMMEVSAWVAADTPLGENIEHTRLIPLPQNRATTTVVFHGSL